MHFWWSLKLSTLLHPTGQMCHIFIGFKKKKLLQGNNERTLEDVVNSAGPSVKCLTCQGFVPAKLFDKHKENWYDYFACKANIFFKENR